MSSTLNGVSELTHVSILFETGFLRDREDFRAMRVKYSFRAASTRRRRSAAGKIPSGSTFCSNLAMNASLAALVDSLASRRA